MRNKKLTTRRSKQIQRRRRNGSVMIMVVALLVLLALMGTAWIATVRNDRSASAANVANAENELLLEGVKNIAAAVVGIDAVHGRKAVGAGQPVYRPPADLDDQNPPQPVYVYRDAVCPIARYDGTYNESEDHVDEFLASRVPLWDSTKDVPYWPAISAPLVHEGVSAPIAQRLTRGQFESPEAGRPTYRERLRMQPTIVSLTGAGGITRTYPALKTGGNTYLAADADGDGAADAGLWRLPVGEQNGITWYAAVRIVDNNSVVNAAVAWDWAKSWSDFDKDVYTGLDYYPSNVSLRSLLPGDSIAQRAQLVLLNSFRTPGLDASKMVQDNGNAVNLAYATYQEALWMQLGRRLEYPSFVKPKPDLTRANALGLADEMALARGVLSWHGASSEAKLEQLLPALSVKRGPYSDTDPSVSDPSKPNWYADNFDYSKAAANLRPLLVTRNAVSNHAQVARDPADLTKPYVPAEITGAALEDPPVKTSLNTASFADLWLAYWNVMADRTDSATKDTTPFGRLVEQGLSSPAGAKDDPYYGMRFTGPDEEHPWRMFRSSIRDLDQADKDYRFFPQQQLLLRSAIAALNTIRLRSSFTHDSEKVSLKLHDDRKVDVKLYGYRDPQPFITEVYVHANTALVVNADDQAKDDQNPNGYIAVELHNSFGQAISLENYRLARVERKGTYPLKIEHIHTFGKDDVIPAAGFVVLENEQPSGNSGVYRPRAAEKDSMAAGDPGWIKVARLHEAADHELVILRPAGGNDVELNMMPVDQFDFTGLDIPAKDADAAFSWHYARECRELVPGKSRWECVYPGRYDGTKTRLAMRQEGTTDANSQYTNNPPPPTPPDPPTVPEDPWIKSPPPRKITLGKPSEATYGRRFAIRLERPAGDVTKYPFGGFARMGDVMQVPFIGAYVIYDGTEGAGKVLEMNAITMDSMFADDADKNNDSTELVGRFCPLQGSDWGTDFKVWRYRWAMKVFDHFTVNAPHEDFLPDAPANAGAVAVANAWVNQANTSQERLVGVEGLVNINTAPWKVLAALPWNPPSAGGVMPDQTAIAQAIATERDANGPFNSLFELYSRVSEVRNLGTDQDANGQLEIEERFSPLIRMSNLITTRSDTFTAYLLIQGWRGAGSSRPELVVQRRTGVIIDRNRVRSGTGDVKMHPFPVE